jgi:hypothetical protein
VEGRDIPGEREIPSLISNSEVFLFSHH